MVWPEEYPVFTEKKGSGLSGGSSIALVWVIKNEFAALSILLTSLPSLLAVKLIVANIVQRVLLVFLS